METISKAARQRMGWAAWLALAWCYATPVVAQPARNTELVILLQPTIASVGTHRSLARIKDELSADRFTVVLADSNVAGDPVSMAESAARDPGAIAVIALLGDPETGQTELCVVERAAGRTAVRRALVVVDDPGRMPEILSIHALELLHATALELSVDADRRPRSSPPPPNLRAEGPPSPGGPASTSAETELGALETGVVLLHSLSGPPPAIAPIGRFRLRLTGWLHARVSIAGLGSSPRIQTDYGSATVSQSVGTVEVGAIWRRAKRVRPSVFLGAGVLHVSVQGAGNSPYEGREPGRWSVAFAGGVGVAFALRSHLALTTELAALMATPHPTVRFVDTKAATIGFPSLLLSLALQVTL
jgi:hypothetical protein